MIIQYDRSQIKSANADWIKRGYAQEDVNSLSLRYVNTDIQTASAQNFMMASVMAAIAKEFVCYQYEKVTPIPFNSSKWDFFFWCRNTNYMRDGSEISGRDYSYFTLTTNSAHTTQQRIERSHQILQFLKAQFGSNPNLEVTVQYHIWYDTEKIVNDAKSVQYLLDGVWHTYNMKEGRFLLKNDQLFFRPKYAKRNVFRVDCSDILKICWELDLIPDPLKESHIQASGNTPLTIPYEQYGATHPLQLKVNAYPNGNLSIELYTWEHEYAEPWLSLTVNLEGIRQKNCAFIDVSNDKNFSVWLIRHGLAIPTGVVRRSGGVEYPEYRFRGNRLEEIDQDGYAEYLNIQNVRCGA